MDALRTTLVLVLAMSHVVTSQPTVDYSDGTCNNDGDCYSQIQVVQRSLSYLQNEMRKVQSEMMKVQADNRDLKQENNNLLSKVENLQIAQNETQMVVADMQRQLTNLRLSDCADVYRSGQTDSGVYTIVVQGQVTRVFCNMENGGGWTVFQRRQDGSVDFYLPWSSYQAGFGDVSGEHWLGLETLHALTATHNYSLRVEMSDFAGATAWAEYTEFRVGPESNNYTLTVTGYSGTAGDSLAARHNGQQFSTHDRDNDASSRLNCAERCHGAFWYGYCYHANPNGRYFPTATLHNEGVLWYWWKNTWYSMKTFTLMLRPRNYSV